MPDYTEYATDSMAAPYIQVKHVDRLLFCTPALACSTQVFGNGFLPQQMYLPLGQRR
jgi:hypothetical protein